MALVRNISKHSISLAEGTPLAPQETGNADLSDPFNDALLQDGDIVVTDPDVPPPAAATRLVPVVAEVPFADHGPFVLDTPVEISDVDYDTDGNLTSITQGGVTTTYTYDADGNVDTETRGDTVRTFQWDADGNLTGATVA